MFSHCQDPFYTQITAARLALIPEIPAVLQISSKINWEYQCDLLGVLQIFMRVTYFLLSILKLAKTLIKVFDPPGSSAFLMAL